MGLFRFIEELLEVWRRKNRKPAKREEDSSWRDLLEREKRRTERRGSRTIHEDWMKRRASRPKTKLERFFLSLLVLPFMPPLAFLEWWELTAEWRAQLKARWKTWREARKKAKAWEKAKAELEAEAALEAEARAYRNERFKEQLRRQMEAARKRGPQA